MTLAKLAALLQHRDTWLILTFIAFILVQFVFAGIYFWLYRRRRDNFSFNRDILVRQLHTTKASAELAVSRTQKAIEALYELKRQLDSGVAPQARPNRRAIIRLPSGRECTLVFSVTGGFTPAARAVGNFIEIVDADGGSLFSSAVTKPGSPGYFDEQDPEEWQRVVPGVMKQLTSEREKLARQVETFSTADPDIWSYWDFLYFSTVVQTTVGLGDILPNSTGVRSVVTAQIVLGYALLIVVLNLVLSS